MLSQTALRQLFVRGLVSIGSLSLVACGGGGGGGGSTTNSNVPTGTATLNASNAETAASLAYGTVAGFTDLAGNSPISPSTIDGVTPRFDLGSFLRNRAEDLAATTALARAVQRTTVPCGSGNITQIFNDADDNGKLSTGDSYELQFNNCNDGGLVNGNMKLDKLVLEGDYANSRFVLAMRMTYSLTVSAGGRSASVSGQTETELRIDGQRSTFTYRFSGAFANGRDSITSGTEIRVQQDNRSQDYTLYSRGGVSSPVIGGTFSCETTTPLGGNDDPRDPYVSSGTILIRGANNSQLQVIILDRRNVRIEVDEDGDNKFETVVDSTVRRLNSDA